ncbi:MAG: P-II family nitrogen regulator [Hydrogenovibrio sp.]|uniref:P-II family nitrogen regulator n=1 Tax=Hydrogenovibrio sp. TaxID=2065821 RepID=UPI00287096CB|nr:P-II family nitrogen regulator [Hydrogenovibrio sp.]MDR9498821.1 P-II family nitrogen regulator [Hydrogenovibrio sp.]
MKLVKAVITPHKLSDVREGLANLGTYGLTASEVKGYGRQKGQTEIYRGAEYEIAFIPKVMIEIVVKDESLDDVVQCIVQEAQTGKIGDGKIFVLPVENAIRVRTNEQGDQAL